MPRYRVIAYTRELEESVHTDVDAADAMAAAIAICGEPLLDNGSQGADLAAHVAPMNKPVDLHLFYRPRAP